MWEKKIYIYSIFGVFNNFPDIFHLPLRDPKFTQTKKTKKKSKKIKTLKIITH